MSDEARALVQYILGSIHLPDTLAELEAKADAALQRAHAAGVAAERARWLAAVETEQMETREGSPADYALDQLLRKMRP